MTKMRKLRKLRQEMMRSRRWWRGCQFGMTWVITFMLEELFERPQIEHFDQRFDS